MPRLIINGYALIMTIAMAIALIEGGIYFRNYDNDKDYYDLIFGITVIANVVISFVYLKIDKANDKLLGYTKDDILFYFTLYNSINLIPRLSVLTLFIFFMKFLYTGIKILIKKDILKIKF